MAFAPYGERYATSGSPAWTFTGQTADVVSDEYDFMYREYHSTQGRWISPDPAGMSAVTLGNPQSWNRYAYVINNPLSLIDPSGLDFCIKALLDAAGNVMACFDEPGDLGHRGNFWGGWGPGDFGDGGSGVGFNGGFSGGPSGSWGEQPPVPLAPSPLIPANIMQILNFVLFNQPLDWNSVLWGTNCMPFCDARPGANKEDPTYANRIHALFQTPETANIWKQADCTINGPATEAIKGVADGAAFDSFKGAVTATSAGTSVAKGVVSSLKEGTFTFLFGVYSYGKMMGQVGWNMVMGCKGD